MTDPTRAHVSTAIGASHSSNSLPVRSGWFVVIGLISIAFSSPARAQEVAGLPIPNTGWRLLAVDSEEAGYPATNAFDGDPTTLWSTEWLEDSPPPPHDLEIDLGAVYNIGGIRVLPRQIGSVNGRVAQFQVLSSLDAVTWTLEVAAGTWPNTADEHQALFAPRSARYVWLRTLAEVNGQPWTTVAEVSVLGVAAASPTGAISKAGWRLRSVDSQDTVGGAYGAVNAFDGDPSTIWATKWRRNVTPPPHEIQIDLGGVYDVGGFGYLPRQDGLTSGRIAQYAFYVSVDGDSWGAPVAAATFANAATEQQVQFTPKQGQYIRLRALSEVDDAPWTVVAELDVYSAGASVPPRYTSTLQFTVSVDDATVLGYVLKVYRAGQNPSVASPLSASNLSKPAAVYGICTVDITELISSLPSGAYAATVSAVGAGGTAQSAISEPFIRP